MLSQGLATFGDGRHNKRSAATRIGRFPGRQYFVYISLNPGHLQLQRSLPLPPFVRQWRLRRYQRERDWVLRPATDANGPPNIRLDDKHARLPKTPLFRAVDATDGTQDVRSAAHKPDSLQQAEGIKHVNSTLRTGPTWADEEEVEEHEHEGHEEANEDGHAVELGGMFDMWYKYDNEETHA